MAKMRVHELAKELNKSSKDVIYALKGHERFENEIVEVLVEGPSKNNPEVLTGYTRHNMLVNFPNSQLHPCQIGDLVNVRIVKAFSWHLLGEMV